MKKYLAPSMLAADFTQLGIQLRAAERAGADFLHVDMMDGMFVPCISFGMPVISSIRPALRLPFDVHMMVTEPERYLEDVKKSGADRICVHVEACKNPAAALAKIKELGAQPAIALSPETPVSAVVPYLAMCQQALVMSVHPGFGGQMFLSQAYEKIRELSLIRSELGLDYLIEVDGGVKTDNAEAILQSGADILVAGSAVFKENVEENVKAFREILSRYEN